MIAKDKQLHLVAGFIIGFAVSWFSGYPSAGFLAAIVAGVAKEGYDMVTNAIARKRGKPEPHTPDIDDALYTIVGGAAGCLPVLFLHLAGISV